MKGPTGVRGPSFVFRIGIASAHCPDGAPGKLRGIVHPPFWCFGIRPGDALAKAAFARYPCWAASCRSALHPNPAFRQTLRDRKLAFARARGFGILSVNGPEGPLAAHVPFLLNHDASLADLHLARSNPIARAGLPAPALIAVAGPDAYVSPDWYGPPDQVPDQMPDQVPTWNYVAVHLRGMLEPMDEDTLRPHVDALSAEREGRIAGKAPWTSGKMTKGAMPRMMRIILPFRFRVVSVEGTWKLNQNKPADVRARAAAALSQGDAGAQDIARLMREGPETGQS